MKIIIAIVISLIVGNYALSPPLANVGMVPDYALENQDFEEIELEIDGDYINLDIGSNQGEEKDLKENDFSFNTVAGSKSRSADIVLEDFPSIHILEDIESRSITYYDGSESSVTDIPSEPSSELVVEDEGFSFTNLLHKGNGGHYTLPVELNPTI